MKPAPTTLLALTTMVVLSSAVSAADKIDFNRDIRPILSDRCFSCHGPDDKSREAGLRLDDKHIAFGELESGETAIVAGDVDASAMIARIIADDETVRMPPAESGKSLTPTEIELLQRWIEQGAPWAEHWSFVKPQKHELPAVKNGRGARMKSIASFSRGSKRRGLRRRTKPTNGR